MNNFHYLFIILLNLDHRRFTCLRGAISKVHLNATIHWTSSEHDLLVGSCLVCVDVYEEDAKFAKTINQR